MNIETFSELIKKHAGVRAIKRYQTDVPDYRFGIPETYVAASFEKIPNQRYWNSGLVTLKA